MQKNLEFKASLSYTVEHLTNNTNTNTKSGNWQYILASKGNHHQAWWYEGGLQDYTVEWELFFKVVIRFSHTHSRSHSLYPQKSAQNKSKQAYDAYYKNTLILDQWISAADTAQKYSTCLACMKPYIPSNTTKCFVLFPKAFNSFFSSPSNLAQWQKTDKLSNAIYFPRSHMGSLHLSSICQGSLNHN